MGCIIINYRILNLNSKYIFLYIHNCRYNFKNIYTENASGYIILNSRIYFLI